MNLNVAARNVLFWVFALTLFGYQVTAGANTSKNLYVSFEDQRVQLYAQSHALLIGVSNYRHWSSLPSVPGELDDVSRELKKRGFSITRVDDPSGRELEKALEDFIYEYGYDKKNRLLIYFSGHGHTIGDKGYLVPADAVEPVFAAQEKDFKRKALNMTRILAMSREADAKHMLFLFDSCFSGTIFTTRESTTISPVLNVVVSKPVRYFITAGSANQVVPAKSVFSRLFVDALRESKGDLNGDSFVTGRELGLFLRNEVPVLNPNQTPQAGNIADYDLSQGDIVFFPKAAARASGDKKKHTAKQAGYSPPAIYPRSGTTLEKVGAVLKYDKVWDLVMFAAKGADLKVGDTVYLKSKKGEYVSLHVGSVFGDKASVELKDYQGNYEAVVYVAK